MNNRNTSLIATIASAVLCGCPGLFLCIFGAVTATGNMPYSTELNGVSNSGVLPSTYGVGMLCLALLLLLIPAGIWFYTRRKPTASLSDNDPLPPASGPTI